MFSHGRSSKKSKFPNEPIRIAAFPSDLTPWRIDWFGEVEFADRTVRSRQPSVSVFLSPLKEDGTFDGGQENQRRVTISIGTLTLLRVGDIWRGGFFDSRPDYTIEDFKDLQVEKATTNLVKAGLNLDHKGFLLPLSEHRGHRQSTQSYCMMVDLPEERKLIIPCMELIRFYFGTSSSLLTKLFMPPLSRKTLYEKAYFNHDTRRLWIRLADRISGASAPDIGRLHMDHISWQVAANVGVSMLNTSTIGQPVYPKANFPFVGKTDLNVSGQWCSFAGRPKSTFVVYNIRSCTHPFPFQSLQYETANSGERTSDANNGGNRRKGAKDSNDQALVELDPSNNLAAKAREFYGAQRFIDLKDKGVWKSKVLTIEGGSSPVGSQPLPIDAAAMGDGGSGRRIRALEVALSSSPEELWKQPIPYFLRARFLPKLKDFREAHPEAEIELLTVSGEDGWTVPLLALEKTQPVDSAIRNIQENLHTYRTSAFTIGIAAWRVCIVIVDEAPAFVRVSQVSGLDANSIWEMLQSVPTDFCQREKFGEVADDPYRLCFAEIERSVVRRTTE